MRQARRLVRLVGFLVLLLGVTVAAEAATLCVNPGGTGGCFATITLAIAAPANPGDTITVAPGTYIDNVTITGLDGLIITGTGLNSAGGPDPSQVIIDGDENFDTFSVDSANVKIKNLTGRNSGGHGIAVTANGTGSRLTDIRIRGTRFLGDCINIDTGDVRVVRADIAGCGNQAIVASGDD